MLDERFNSSGKKSSIARSSFFFSLLVLIALVQSFSYSCEVLPAPYLPLQEVVPGAFCSSLVPPAPVSPLQLVCSDGGCF